MSTPDTRNMEATEHDASDVTIGLRLQRLREQKGLSIREVYEETHVSCSNLTAIEAENFDQLPAATFVRGQIIMYASYLGLDGEETARLFLKERDKRQQPKSRKNRPAKQNHFLSPKKLAEPAHISSATVASILLLLIVVSVTAFCLYTGWNPFAYFLDQGQQQSTPPLTGTMAPRSENEQAATDNHPKTTPSNTATIRLQDSAATGAVKASVTSLTVKQEDKTILNTPDALSNH